MLVALIDLRAYVVALQRRAAAPAGGHVQKSSAPARWVHAGPLRIRCPAMPSSGEQDIRRDAAFR